MIIDCFPFFNELDVLELRLNILDSVVDKFVLVEASKTQSLIDKPFYFEDNKDRFAKFLHKIVHIKVQDYPNEGGWAMENFQRNCILRGLKHLDLNTHDIVGISDVDEIWNPDIITHIQKSMNGLVDRLAIEMKYLVFYLNLETQNKSWIGTVFSTYENILKTSPQNIRASKDNCAKYINAGWHFGYQGGANNIYQKYLSCIEPIDKSLLPTREIFTQEFHRRIKDGGSFIFSDNLSDESIKLKKIDTDLLPDYITNHIDEYRHMIY